MLPARRHHGRLAGAGGRGAVRHPPARRPRRPRDQGRAPGGGRLRPRLRHDASTASPATSSGSTAARSRLTLDLKDPARRTSCAACSATADVFVQNLAPGAAARLGLGAEELQASAPPAGRLRHLRLRRRTGPTREEGLRPAGPGRGRARLDHRHAETRRRSASRSRTSPPGCTRTRGILDGAARARTHRQAARTSRSRCSRRTGGVDGLPALLRVRRRAAAAARGRGARDDLPLRPVPAGDGGA